MESQIIKIALAEDHRLVRTVLASEIKKTGNFSVVIEAGNGMELIEKIQAGIIPDVILLDLNMPEFDGYETALWLKLQHPDIHIIMLTMYNSEFTMIRLLQAGVKGFLTKDTEVSELRFAINSVIRSGAYNTNQTTGRLINLIRKDEQYSTLKNSTLNDIEYRFLQLVCTHRTYKEIAKEMHLTTRAIDNIRDNLFNKLDVKNRVGLAMYAIRNGIQTF